MSWQATAAVLAHKVGNPTRKLILLGYADHARADGTVAWLTPETAAEYAECDPRTVQRHLGPMIEAGLMREGDQRQVAHLDPRRRPIVYDLAMTPEQAAQWAADRQPGRRDADAARGAAGGEAGAPARWGDKASPQSRGDNRDAPGVTDNLARGDSGVTLTTREPPENHPDKRSSSTDIEGAFAAWWSTYPKRAGKIDAERKYRLALRRKDVTEEILLEGARRYRDDPTREDAYTKDPSTWLNRGCWADEGPTRPGKADRFAGARQRAAEEQAQHPAGTLALVDTAPPQPVITIRED